MFLQISVVLADRMQLSPKHETVHISVFALKLIKTINMKNLNSRVNKWPKNCCPEKEMRSSLASVLLGQWRENLNIYFTITFKICFGLYHFICVLTLFGTLGKKKLYCK